MVSEIESLNINNVGKTGGVLFHRLSDLCHFSLFVFEGKAQKKCMFLQKNVISIHLIIGLGRSASIYYHLSIT